ncbi:MAG: transporter substrate-binding domain-containing protein [Acutalibacteraceae bacterium]|nr:transporter substrate-binding domain-containing protein [Acutalibacteraceae bacterium]
MKKILALILAMVMLVACFASCGNAADNTASNDDAAKDSDLAYIQDKGTLIVGITDFEPMDYKEDGSDEWTGFDAELARLVGKELGVTVEFQEINWKMKETELSSKTIDCIWNGLTWDEERAENMSLTDYYMLNRQVLVVATKNADKYTSVDSLAGANVAAESGSAGESVITESLTSSNYIEKDAQIDVLTELIMGTVDAGVIDYVMANYLINKEGSSFADLTIVENALTTQDEYYSIAFRKGSDVTAKVNAILKDLKADGTVDTLAKKYGLVDAIVD